MENKTRGLLFASIMIVLAVVCIWGIIRFMSEKKVAGPAPAKEEVQEPLPYTQPTDIEVKG